MYRVTIIIITFWDLLNAFQKAIIRHYELCFIIVLLTYTVLVLDEREPS